MTLTVVDIDTVNAPPDTVGEFGGVVVGVTDSGAASAGSVAQAWLDHASFTITSGQATDRRIVHVESIDDTIATLDDRHSQYPVAATVCDDVLRAQPARVPTASDTRRGLTIESLAYSTLQGGREFAGWLHDQGPRVRHEQDDPVVLHRDGPELEIRFNRPDRHNAFSNALRAGLIDGLRVALADDTVGAVTFTGNGPSFCSGGDLREFGLLTDPADAHLARTRYSPAILLAALADRLGPALHARVHGAVLGSGLEMASFCGTVTAEPGAVFGLPELRLGLLPGAGGTVSVPRRIGRWRTAYLVLSGAQIDVHTAADWELIDGIESRAD
ncbi:enoyl-CoA hydratase/isomerase family protein [Gordonia sp. HY002]|uniref:enoyl-CoA hydratase/isomerase family protein n=1 Tax=Gordonia zhenghanii TaxID=2911516 RepID=UPI001EEFFE3D|nr:enoyl-CoA hydratase/isomerase family protein [Gordonia zhenghanii]MCF8571926.1 enoyl-CoA hydratase/isomerase family protein [Gordonia zhenghanii]MCF8606996.1 enoyl-CoA hydratase/isomerase family protein [Gordonia zhenghanii]